jgi:Ca-activated chloride channel family protein
MGRHASERRRAWRPRSVWAGLVAVGVLGGLGAGGVVPPLPRVSLPGGEECARHTVHLVVEPELGDVVREAVAPLDGTRLPAGGCLATDVRTQEAAETVAASEILPPDRAPQIWVPDSDVWVAKLTRWRAQPAPRFASSPVVVATSRLAVDRLGWSRQSPSWNDVLRGSRPVAVPGIHTDADGLYALIALWQSLGKGTAADQAVVNVVLRADRGEVPSVTEALAVARSGSANSPVVPVTEQAVAAGNAAGDTRLSAVYPREGSPLLTYPVVRVSTSADLPDLKAATLLVLDRLGSPATRELARRHGFRDPDGAAPPGAAGTPRGIKALKPPEPAEVDRVVERVESLTRPTRLLAVVDASLSMRAQLRDGLTRIQLAAAATRLGAGVLPDSSSVGAWVFASRMQGDRDWRQVAPIAPLGSSGPRGQSHRAFLTQLSSNPERFLTGGGTALFDTTLAAFRAMHQDYDPRASNGVILLSDGANDDTGGASLDDVLAEIRRLNAGDARVQIYTAGLGPDADYAALRRISAASGGWTYRIDTAAEGQAALLDGLRRNAEGLESRD